MISKINCLRRRDWCQTRLHFTVENFWKNVIFTNETRTVLGKDLRIYIWLKDDEKWAPRCLGEHVDREPSVKASVMFWGCITYSGVGILVPVNGNINSQKYIDILEANLWPFVAKVFSDRPWIFQDDNATPHTSQLT